MPTMSAFAPPAAFVPSAVTANVESISVGVTVGAPSFVPLTMSIMPWNGRYECTTYSVPSSANESPPFGEPELCA